MVYFPNEAVFHQKKQAILTAGARSLHIVSDFDGTLTHASVDGMVVPSSYAYIREKGYISPEYVAKANELAAKYRPIEKNESIPVPVRSAAMDEWWSQHLAVLVQHGMNRGVLADIAEKHPAPFRPSTPQLLLLAHEKRVPFLVFSAGLGDIIETWLTKNKLLLSNVHIIANKFSFDAHGKATGYQSRIVHVFNKNEQNIAQEPYGKEITHRKNVIVLGDSLGDAHMTDGIIHDTLLRIGFLNGDHHKRGLFGEHYDALIEDDGDLDFVVSLLDQIT